MAKKPTITTVSSGYYGRQALNDNFEALRDAFDNFVSRDGETPNTMQADLDLNSNDILNAKSIKTDQIVVAGSDISDQITALDEFTDLYLGEKASDPATDNDGDPLQTGAFYFNTTNDIFRVYDGSAFVNGVAPVSSFIMDLLDDTSQEEAQQTLGTPVWKDDVAAVLADTNTYTAGTIIRTRKEGFAYECVASSGNLGQTNAGGQELDVLPDENGFVSVKAFGAVGDNVSDDTAEIQAALDASISVYFPAGNYKISTVLDLRDNHNVQGAGGREGANIRANGCTAFKSENNQQVVIKNFRLYGDGTAGKFGIYAYNNPRGIHIESVYADGFGSAPYTPGDFGATSGCGFKLEYECWGARLVGLAAERCAAGLVMDSASASIIAGGSIRQNGGSAIHLNGCRGVSINGGVFEKAWGSNGAVTGSGYSIRVESCGNCNIAGVYTEQSIDGAFLLKDSNNIVVDGCLMDGASGTLIDGFVQLENSKWCRVTHCYIEGLYTDIGPDKCHIYCDASSSDNIFIGNELEADGVIGAGNYAFIDENGGNIYIANSRTDARINGSDVTLEGVYMAGRDGRFQDLYARDGFLVRDEAGIPIMMQLMNGGTSGTGDGAALRFVGANGNRQARIYTESAGTFTRSPDLVFAGENDGEGLTDRMRLKYRLTLELPKRTSDPSVANPGEIYYNTDTDKLRLYDGTSWVSLN